MSSGTVFPSRCEEQREPIADGGEKPAAFVPAFVLFVILCSLFTVADLLTKYCAFSSLGMPGTYKPEQPEGESAYWIWSSVFGFQTSLNTGGLFGLGQDSARYLAALSCLFLAGIFCYVILCLRKPKNLRLNLPVAYYYLLPVIAAGIAGNLFDRLGLHGLTFDGKPVYAVRDFILVKFGSYNYPNFNLADSFLVCSVIFLVAYSFWKKEEPPSFSSHS